jgi:predicted nucleic acid-binding protein
MIALFDTNIVVDALNGVADADVEYQRYDKVLISRITWMEVLVGEKGDDTKLRDFLKSKFEIVSIELDVSEEAVKIRRSNKIKLPDAIILATARIQKVPLVTRNTKDFKPEWDGVRIPYELLPKTKEVK